MVTVDVSVIDTADIAIDVVGQPGPAGIQGPAGPQGAAGPQGVEGPQGPPGNDGLDGATGPQGIQGIQGPEGPQGPQGIQGEQGLQGPQGLPGADSTVPGPQGPAGADGLQGPQGIQGEQGIQGIKGDTGDIGPQGPQGIQGETGLQGPAGADGAVGPQGPAGADGTFLNQYQGEWLAQAYAIGDIVTHQGSTYIAETPIAAGVVTLVGTSFVYGNGNIVLPAGIVDGDLIILATARASTVQSSATGYTLRSHVNTPQFWGQTILSKTAVAADSGATVSVTNIDGWGSVYAFVLRGGAYATQAGSAAEGTINYTIPSVTPIGAADGVFIRVIQRSLSDSVNAGSTINDGTVITRQVSAMSTIETYSTLAASGTALFVPNYTTGRHSAAHTIAIQATGVFNPSAWTLIAEKGATGATGATGSQGIQGIQGEIGPTGPQGPAGADGADGTGYTRTTVSGTTSSIAAGSGEDMSLATAEQFNLIKCVVDQPDIRVRLYASTAFRTADLSRPIGTVPTGEHGLLFEFVSTAALQSLWLSPVAVCYLTSGTDVYARIDNGGVAAAVVNLTLTWLRIEG
jgi:collagen type II alpha